MTEVLDRERHRTAGPPSVARPGIAAIAAVGAGILVYSASRYGYFGDELYFLAAGRRLSVDYADQGPLVPLLAALMDALAPGSFWAVRLPAVLLTVAAIVVCALTAREFGGGRAAQLLAAGGYASSPFLLLQGSMLTTNTVDTALWVIITWLVVRWVRVRDDRLLLAAALVTAVDMQVKWLIPFFWLCAVAASLLCGPRELVRRPLLWLGGAVVVVTTIPQLVWQAGRDWPYLALGQVIGEQQGLLGGRLLFVPASIAIAGPLGVLLLIGGVWALLAWEPLRPYRFLGVAMLLLWVVFMLTGGRIYYPAGMYGVVLAAGAVGWVAVLRSGSRVRRRLLIGFTALLTAVALLLMGSAIPWRSPEDITPVSDDVEAALNIGTYGSFGWPELTDEVTAAYDALAPTERAATVVLTETYWQASALDQLGRDRLPPIYSPKRGFGYFGSPTDDAATVLAVGFDEPELRERFTGVEPVGRVDTRLGFPGETKDVTFYRCTGLKGSWSTVWPEWMSL
ncbi:glycosyltransferase family 39 protein [Nocardia sp. NPDC050406]|uniref:glycosyltransferase family 39 protein n=1 Tax=Nocardia sp. NPDC050406 TaxID=3364318 RepID=UPI0037B05E2D